MTRLEIGVVSFEQYPCDETTSIEFFEHFHARRTDEFLRIFLIDESFTETMKCLNIYTESISSYEAPKPLSHSKRTCFCVGECEYISGRNVCFLEDICDSQGQQLSFTSSWSCDDSYRAVNRVYSEFLGSIESGIR